MTAKDADALRDGIGGTPAAPKKTMGERILRAGIVVLLAHVCVRASGYICLYWIANKYSRPVSDVFNIIWESVLTTAFLIGEQCLGPAYLPVFTSAREKDGEARAWHFTSVLFNVQAVILCLVIAFFMMFPRPILRVLTKWDSRVVQVTTVEGTEFPADVHDSGPNGFNLTPLSIVPSELLSFAEKSPDNPNSQAMELPAPTALLVPREAIQHPEKIDTELNDRRERFELASNMLPYSALGLLGMSLASLTYMLLNAYKEFFWAAFGDAAIKIAIFVGAIAGTVVGKGDWRYIGAGVVLGGTAKLLTHVLALNWTRLKQYRLTFNLADPYVNAFILLVLPLLAGIFISRVRDSVIQYVLTAKPNLPTYYKLGRTIAGGVNSLIPYALSIALLPYFCDISARNDNEQLGAVLTRVIRILIWLFVPLSIIMAASALPICLAVYSGENIQLKDTQLTAVIVQIFCLQMTFEAVEMMVMQAFFSSRRVIAPTIAGLVFSGLTAAAAYVLVDRGFVHEPYSILISVALCLVVARILKVIVLVAMLKWTVPVLPWQETLVFVIRTGAAAAITAGAAWAVALGLTRVAPAMLAHVVHHAVDGKPTLLERLYHGGEVAVISALGLAIYLALSLALKMEEPREFWQWTKEKLRRRKDKNLPPEKSLAAGN